MNKTNKPHSNNICCRIFKEQINLINQLPEQERGVVLLSAINNAFFQFENQNDNQNENQFDCAYISVSVSNSLSDISKVVLELLNKNIVCREFSPNYGGRRIGSGRKQKKEHSPRFDIFIDLVISCFEPQIKTTEQKSIWVANNVDYLHDIFDYCNEDFELAIIVINKCFAPLKRGDMNYSYKAVVRNLSMYYSQALKVVESGKQVTWNDEQLEILKRVEEKKEND